MFLALTVLCGLAYPLLVTAVTATTMSGAADGSLLRKNGVVVGSSLLGQGFSQPRYFHPRPSAAGADGYDAMASAASNLGPTNEVLLASVAERATAYRQENGLADITAVPVDAVTASGSGLDPHISIANARLQVPRVAAERKIAVDEVNRLIDNATDGRSFGFLGQPGVNVLRLNLSLDARS